MPNKIIIKNKNFKNDLLLLLKLTQLIISANKIKIKIIYLNKIWYKLCIKTVTKKTVIF